MNDLLTARDSGKFKTHRDYVKALFMLHHKVIIPDPAFVKLKFHYSKTGVTKVEAPKGSYVAT